MKGLCWILVWVVAVLMTGCSDSLDLPGDEDRMARTVIVYMSAENSLSGYGAVDLQEMYAAVDSIPDTCQVVVYYDGVLAPAIYLLRKGSHTLWREYQTDQNSADSSVISATLKDVVRNFSSKHYSLVLWGHGSGWNEQARQKAILVDNNRNTSTGSNVNKGSWLQLPQLGGVLSTLPHLDYLMLDICYMQSAETAAELMDAADYIIGSPAEIPAEGAPYDKIMRALCTADIRGIVNGYADFYGDDKGAALSAIKTDEMGNFCSLSAALVPLMFQRGSMPDVSAVQVYAPYWGSESGKQTSIPVPYDMRSAFYQILSARGMTAEYLQWEEQWRRTVLFPRSAATYYSEFPSITYGSYFRMLTDTEHFGGLSMNIPEEDYEDATHSNNTFFRRLRWYKKSQWQSTGW